MKQNKGSQEAPRQLAPRIESDLDILGGKPVIAGSRLSVETILENLACGDTYEDVLDSYPFLTYEDIYAALLQYKLAELEKRAQQQATERLYDKWEADLPEQLGALERAPRTYHTDEEFFALLESLHGREQA
ncbi:MAG TPA: DUF433 domain-containing protein [Ktedonobacterales bacterium]|jgi:uncharacterized protein (DUF433 family)